MATVDTTLHDKPTSAAASLAAAHSADHPLKLYGGWFCPFVQRAWVVLVEKNIPHQYVEINPYHKAPEFLALNPRGLVPTLAVPVPGGDGKQHKPLYESSVVCEYLDEAFAGHENGEALLPRGEGPAEVYERARCRLWMDHVSSRIVPAFYKLLQHTPDKEEGIEAVRGKLREALKVFAREMDGGGPWFLGARFSLVDVMLAPWAKRLFLIDHYKSGGVGIPKEGERGEDEEVWGRWDRWFEAVVERKSVKDTWSDDAQYVVAYKRYADDTTQSEVGISTRKGNRLP